MTRYKHRQNRLNIPGNVQGENADDEQENYDSRNA